MAVPPRVIHKRRTTITALPLYYSGHLLKKDKGEKDFKKYYGELRGSTIFLYTDDSQDTYTEKVDLQVWKSLELDSTYQNNSPTIFTLSLHHEEVQLKMEQPDTGEEWRGFILTVATMEIPSQLQLMPGQMMRLEEVLAEEKKRLAPPSSSPRPRSRPPLPPRPSFIPAPPSSSSSSSSASASTPSSKDANDSSVPEVPPCFFDVSRQEAAQMLKENPECGNIIIRPSAMADNYALTLRQVDASGPVIKNYKVTSTDSGFVIELDTPVTLPSLSAVLTYFLEKTEHRLHPYVKQEPYDTRIELPPMQSHSTFPTTAPKAVPKAEPKAAPKARVAPMIHTKARQASPPKSPPIKVAENEYVVPDDDDDDTPNKPKQDHHHNHPLTCVEDELREVLQLRREQIYRMDNC